MIMLIGKDGKVAIWEFDSLDVFLAAAKDLPIKWENVVKIEVYK